MLKVLFYSLPGQLTVLSISFMVFMMGYLIYYVMKKMKEESKKQNKVVFMYYIVKTSKSFNQASTDLKEAIVRNGFGTLYVHDIGTTLRNKGIAFAEECKVFEVCNPKDAAKVLSVDMRLNMALPCRISVYTEKGETKIGLIKPVQMLSALSNDDALMQVAKKVEEKIIKMANESK